MAEVPGGRTSAIEERQRELISSFRSMGDLFSQYTYLVELSSRLPVMSEEDRQAATLVDTCQSQVWLRVRRSPDGTVRLQAESDTLIVRGVLYLLCSLLDGRKASEVLQARITFVDETDLHEAFSDERLNGFASICSTIKALCAEEQEGDRA